MNQQMPRRSGYWAKDLPSELVGVMAPFLEDPKVFRLVCKDWKNGFDACTNGLRLTYSGPALHEAEPPWAPHPSAKARLATLGDAINERFKGLKKLDLGDARLDAGHLEHLRGVTSIQSLTLGTWKGLPRGHPLFLDAPSADRGQGALYTKMHSWCLAELKNMGGIIDLDLRGCESLETHNMAFLKGLQLKRLMLGRSKRVGEEAFAVLVDMPLEVLAIENFKRLGVLGMSYLAKLPLKWLSLKGTDIHDEGLACIRHFEHLPQHLSLEACHMLSGEAIHLLRGLHFTSLNLSLLKRLETTDCLAALSGRNPPNAAPPACCLDLYDVPPGQTKTAAMPLVHLALGGCSRLPMAALADLRELKGLVSFSMAYSRNLTDVGLGWRPPEHDGPLSPGAVEEPYLGLPWAYMESLESLSLAGCEKLTDRTLQLLAALVPKKLKTLDLRDTKITDAGVALLAGHPLERLCMRACKALTHAALPHLAGLPLRELDLRFNHEIKDEGMEALAEGLPGLTYLNIGKCTKLTDKGLAHLAGLRLHHLCLNTCGVGVTDAGLAHFVNMPLVYLDVAGCKFVTLTRLRVAGRTLIKPDKSLPNGSLLPWVGHVC